MNLETVSNDANPGRPLGRTQQRVLDAMRRRAPANGTGTDAREIATATGLSIDQIKAALARLRRRNLVRREIVTDVIGGQRYKVNRWWLR